MITTDMYKIRDCINEQKPERAVVVGSGFIGLGLVENLQHREIEVTVIETLDQVMALIDYELDAMVHQHLDFKHVRLALGDGIKAFQ